MNNEVEQVLKEFEELGYEVIRIGSVMSLRNKEQASEITIWLFGREYNCTINNRAFASMITLQEHQLLTKLFKALGWFDE